MIINTKISVGELIDKITILLIKKEKINESSKLQEITKELNYLQDVVTKNKLNSDLKFNEFLDSLLKVNKILWEIEDSIRLKEKHKDFNKDFIELARNVYKNNDKRFYLKNLINLHYGSLINEVKSYENY